MGSSKAVSMYDLVVDNSQEHISAPSGESQAPAPAPAPAQAQESVPASTQEPASAQAQAGAQPDATGAPGEAGAPDYIRDIQSQLAALNSHMAQGGQTPGQPGQGGEPDPLVQIEQQLVDLKAQAEAGEITYAEMIAQTAPLLEQSVSLRVKQDLAQEEEAKQIRGAQDAFLAENPDFMQFVNSPEATAIRQANPIFDNVSAYYAYKAKAAETAFGSLQQQLDALKAQMESSISGAAQSQAKVVGTGGGTESAIPNLGRGDGLKPLEGGLAALKRARAAQ